MVKKAKKITINPVTRIEGHAKITLQLDDSGNVAEARFHVNEFRGFEKFCEGRLFSEMPNITPRICGICPVSHAVASAKAGEMIMNIRPTRTGDLLRRLIHLGQNISSHALSFFHLTSPDILLGWDSDPAKRNILGVAEKYPDLAKRGIRLRKFGQEISERITGKKIHSIGIVPGGVAVPLSEENRKALLDWIPEVSETCQQGIELIKKYADDNAEEIEKFDACETMYLGTVTPDGTAEIYDGLLRFIDTDGKIVADQLDPTKYLDFIAERPVPWSYLKYPYYKPMGPEKGVYRVGPLARLNVAQKLKTPLADAEFKHFKALGNGRPVHGTFYFHYARLIETLCSIEEAELLLQEKDLTGLNTYTRGVLNQTEGIGCSESPRGTLFHHYTTDENGALQKINLLIATGQNNPSMNRSILELSRKIVKGADIPQGVLNRVEGAIRCYDPCLSCSTHSIGSMPLLIEIVDAGGRLVNTVKR